MTKKSKFYIPLSSKGNITFVDLLKFPEIMEVMPSIEDIKINLKIQKDRKTRGLHYSPLHRKVSEEQFKEFEKILSKKKPGHQFKTKVIDVIGGVNMKLPLVQIIQIT